MKRLTDPNFSYTPAVSTDIRQTFARVRGGQEPPTLSPGTILLFPNSRFPIAKPSPIRYNSVFISPWTGDTWAKIDRGGGLWQTYLTPRRGEVPWPLPESIPGSLLNDMDVESFGIDKELPRPLLFRELELLGGLTSWHRPCYDSPVPIAEDAQMNTLMQEIAALRAKEAAGTLTDEELRAVLRKMREGRVAAAAASAAKRAPKVAASAAKAEADKLLAGLLGEDNT